MPLISVCNELRICHIMLSDTDECLWHSFHFHPRQRSPKDQDLRHINSYINLTFELNKVGQPC